MRAVIVLALGAGAVWAFLQPVSYNVAAGVGLILLGVAVMAKGR